MVENKRPIRRAAQQLMADYFTIKGLVAERVEKQEIQLEGHRHNLWPATSHQKIEYRDREFFFWRPTSQAYCHQLLADYAGYKGKRYKLVYIYVNVFGTTSNSINQGGTMGGI